MNNPFRPIRAPHANEIPDHEEHKVEGVDELIEFIEDGHPFGDLAVRPGEVRAHDPVDLARRIQNGEDW